MRYLILGETTLLVPQVYPLSTIDHSSSKWAQLVPQVFKKSNISPFTYLANRIITWHFFLMTWHFFLLKNYKLNLHLRNEVNPFQISNPNPNPVPKQNLICNLKFDVRFTNLRERERERERERDWTSPSLAITMPLSSTGDSGLLPQSFFSKQQPLPCLWVGKEIGCLGHLLHTIIGDTYCGLLQGLRWKVQIIVRLG